MRKWTIREAAPQRVGVLLFDHFSNHCLANTVEPLRAANHFAGRKIYDWSILSAHGDPVISSSGIRLSPEGRLGQSSGDLLIVMPSYDYLTHATPATARALRAAAARFTSLAGFDTGAWLLADAGLLTGRRATIHWEEFDSFAETFPDVVPVRARSVADGSRITCVGALAAFDTMLRLIGERHGEALRLEVATLFMSPELAGPHGLPSAASRAVGRAIALMQATLESPLPLPEIARRSGLSLKALETRMRAELGAPPATVYRRLRLSLARKLATETDFSVAEIALRAGYQDPAAMTRAFKAEFGLTPRAVRHGEIRL